MSRGKTKIKFAVILISGLLPACGPAGDGSDGTAASGQAPPVTSQAAANNSPQITSPPVGEVFPGLPYIYQPVAIDPDGDELVWSLTSSPPGMLIDPESGLVVAQSLPSGEHSVNLSVEDGRGASDSQQFTLFIPFGPTIVSSPPEYTYTGTPYRYQLSAIDPAGTALQYSITAGPAGMSIDRDGGLLEWIAADEGQFDIEITVTDAIGGVGEQAFTLTVMATNGLKIISTPVTEAFTTVAYEYPLALISPSADIDYSLNQAPVGMTIDPAIQLIGWVPAEAGDYRVELVATNKFGYTDTQQFTITVSSLEQVDKMFGGIVHGMFAGLSGGDVGAAMQYLTVDAQRRLRPLFYELLPPGGDMAANYTDPVRISINAESAEYMVRRTQGSGDRVFMITFVRDRNREWKINDL